jgi:hypothetical protein
MTNHRQWIGMAALVALVAGWGGTGCKTADGTPQTIITPVRVERVSRLAAYITVRGVLLERPEARVEMERALRGFEELIASEDWSITTAAAIALANGLPILASGEGQIIFEGAILFIDLVGGGQVSLKDNEYARAVIIGAESGLRMGLGKTQAQSTAEFELLAAARSVR